MDSRHEDFDLEIIGPPGVYVVRVRWSPTGDPAAYPFADGVTLFSGDDARRLQAQDDARAGDVTTAAHASGFQARSGWQACLRPGSWQTAILSLDE